MPYAAFIAAFVLSGLMYRFRLRGGRSERPWLTVLFVQGSAFVLGVVMSKAVYVLCQVYRFGLSPLFSLDINHFSFVGFAAGSLLGARLFLNLVDHTSHGSVPSTNLYAPCWAMLLALVRAGEYFFAREGLTGLGDVVENEAHMFFPLSVAAGSFRFYAVFMLECACALLCCGVCLLFQKLRKDSYREGFGAERTAFYLALMQIFCQRLLAGDDNKWLFVQAEQVLCALVVMFLLIRYSVMTRWLMKEKFSWRRAVPAVVAFLCMVVIGLAELAMDKPYYFWDVSQTVCLFIILGALLVIAVTEIVSARRRKAAIAQHT